MKTRSSLTLLACVAVFAGCASAPKQAGTAAETEKKPVWSVATEEETAAAIDKKFEEAAKSYVKLKKDGVLLFCKKQKEMGSNIPQLTCITESQLRNQVETMDDYRQRRRDAGRCTTSVGCGAGM